MWDGVTAAYYRKDTESAIICGRAELSRWSVCSEKPRKIVRGGVSERVVVAKTGQFVFDSKRIGNQRSFRRRYCTWSRF